MQWVNELVFGTATGHSILLISVVIAVGLFLGKFKFFGISFGSAYILFMGIVIGYIDLEVNAAAVHFFQEIGLILFVFAVGIQVGPNFFSSFKTGGLKLNFLTALIVLLSCLITLVIYHLTSIDIGKLVGLLSGSITNTPSLGAAQETFNNAALAAGGLPMVSGETNPQQQTVIGYAIAYPFGVIGIIISMFLIKVFFRIKLATEFANYEKNAQLNHAIDFNAVVKNPQLEGLFIRDLYKLLNREIVISRLFRNDVQILPHANTQIQLNDHLHIVANNLEEEDIVRIIGIGYHNKFPTPKNGGAKLIPRKILLSNRELNGKTIRQLKITTKYNAVVTRVIRAGVGILAKSDLALKMGDTLTVVGEEQNLASVEVLLGNSLARLEVPNLLYIFVGIGLGILIGSIPFYLPGIAAPIKLGIAGGPLVAAILISNFGYKYIVTFTLRSANLMVRDLGMCLFLACVGLTSGSSFFKTLFNEGLVLILYAIVIAMLPLLIVGIIARLFMKLNYFTIMGLMAGSTTDPPALAYANDVAGNDVPSISYATVYPLAMFLRIVSIQVLVIYLLSFVG